MREIMLGDTLERSAYFECVSCCWRHQSTTVLATGLDNTAVVQVWTKKTFLFGSRAVKEPVRLLLGGANQYTYPSTRGLCWVWFGPSVVISGSQFRVSLFMVAFRYPTTTKCKISTLVYHCHCMWYWLPFQLKQADTCSVLHPEVQCERFFVLHHEQDSRYRTATFTVKAVSKLQMDQCAPATAQTPFGELMEILDSVSKKSQCRTTLHEQKVVMGYYHLGNHSLTNTYRASHPVWYPMHHRLRNRSLLNL
jgi:hypothetical protein